MNRHRWRPGPPLLGVVTGWAALFAWTGLVTRPWDYLVAALLGGVAMALAGSVLRTVPLPAYVVPLAQVVVGALALNVVIAHDQSFLRVVPTLSSVREVVFSISNGAASLNTYASPVAANQHDTRAMLMACGLLVLWSVDVLAFTVHRPSLVALPLLITLSIPVSILEDPLALPVFVLTTLLFLRLLANEHLDRFRSWGTGSEKADTPALHVLWQVSLVAVVVALLAAPLVPVADLLDKQPGDGDGASGSSLQLSAVNPFVRLRRDLVQKTHTPLVYARTDATSTSYLRTTVLDEFTSDEWRPSARSLPESNVADGAFPGAPGLAPGSNGRTDSWSLQLAPYFSTTWLPLPYPILDLKVKGGWRYDSRTLDVALTGRSAPPELKYSATAFTPTIEPQALESAAQAPRKVFGPMTEVPDDLPKVITTRAREVTKGASTDFAKAVALQDWFREDGGFRYSLQQRSGSGMNLLASFVTDDRVGYCEQYAAAMAAMGRALNIPSRVVVGFLDGTEQPDGRILYTSDERHAWPEMYFTGVGWVRFEPTPSQRTGASPDYTRQSGTAPTPTTAPSQAATPRSTPESAAAAAQDAKKDQGSSIPWWPVVTLLVLLLIGAVPAVVRAFQRRRRLSGSDPAHLAEGAWAELRATALDLGLEWPDAGTPRDQARRVVDQVPAEADEVRSLEGLLVQVERGRYARSASSAGTATLVEEERARTVETVEHWRRSMVSSVDRERGWRRRLWPVSVLRRRG
ncbi:MAG: DUF3488 and transglutaminase-like domain-containing protein [Marmoricola sp.]